MNTGTWGLYYNYTWWGNAIQTAPSVIGKPDFFGSQFEMLTSQQPNRIVNGDFATDSNWGKGSGWSIANGKANRSGETGNSPLTQNVPVVNGRTYTFSYTRKYLSGSSGHTNIFIKLDNVNYSTIGSYISNVVEEHTVTGEFTALFTGDLLWAIYGIGDFTGSINNASIKIVRADNVEAVKCIADWIHETQILDV